MSRYSSSQPQLFHCPTCGASLPVPETASVRCDYCGSNVLVPPEYRSQKASQSSAIPAQVSVHIGSPDSIRPGAKSSSAAITRILMLMIVITVVCLAVGGALSAAGVITTSALFGSVVMNEQAEKPLQMPTASSLPPTEAPTPTPPPPVSVELLFGGEGSGPGQFDDPRYVAVDPDGNIFVGNYQDGRIQKFDPDGKFNLLIQVEPDRNGYTLVRGMAADYRGRLIVARGGDLLIYQTSDGSLIGTLPGQFPGLIHDQVAADPANFLYAVNTGGGSQGLVKYDPEGSLLWEKANLLEGIVPKNKPNRVDQIAVDGLGNIFVLNSIGHEIIRFNAQGVFQDRFGSEGSEPQQFDNPGPFVVDGKSRLFVLDLFEGYILKIFDQNGTYLKTLPWPKELTFPRMLLFDAQGELYTVTNSNQVARMAILPEALE